MRIMTETASDQELFGPRVPQELRVAKALMHLGKALSA